MSSTVSLRFPDNAPRIERLSGVVSDLINQEEVRVFEGWKTLCTKWRQYMSATRQAKGTIELRLYHLGRLAEAFPEGPWSVTFEDLVEWLASHNWKPETARTYRASFRAFWAWMMATGRATASPAHLLPAIRVPRAVPRPAPEAAVARALETHDERMQIAVALGAKCGLRVGEMARARGEHVELDAACDYWLRVIGKGGRERLVPLPADLAVRILACGPGPLFPSYRAQDESQPISAKWLGKLIKRHLGQELTAHTLRHRCATVALEGTKDLRAVQELLGHAKPETTARYTFVRDSRVRAAVAAAA